MHRAIEPTVFRGFHTRCAGLHKILRIEVRACGIRRTCGVHDRKMLLLPQWLKRRHRRMQSEEAIKIDDLVARNIDAGPHRIVRLLVIWHDDVEPVGRAALKQDPEPLVPACRLDRAQRSARQKARNRSGTNNGQCAITKKNSARDRHARTPVHNPVTSVEVSKFQGFRVSKTKSWSTLELRSLNLATLK